MSARAILLVLLGVLYFVSTANGKVQSGSVKTSDSWVFLSKFCYAKGEGNFSYTFGSNQNSSRIFFFDDTPNSWNYVWKNRKNIQCNDLPKYAIGNRTLDSGLVRFKDVVRPHYWFYVVADCDASKLAFSYRITFKNPGGALLTQFSYDEQGICQIYGVFAFLFFVGTVAHLYGVATLIKSGSFHPLVRLLTTSVVLEAWALLCIFIHYAIYTNNGIGAPGLEGLGQVLDMASNLVFMFLLVLLAMGWAITRQEIVGRRALIIIVCVFLLGYLTLFIWMNALQDPAEVTYVYLTAPGIMLLILRTFTFAYFLFCVYRTYQEESDDFKRKFYKIFVAFYSIWFLGLPVIVMFAAAMAIWVRFCVVEALYLVQLTLAYGVMCWLMWPTKVTQYFQINKPDTLLGSKRSSMFTEL